MTLMAVSGKGSRIVFRSRLLEVQRAGQAVHSLPAAEVTEVHCYGEVELAASARAWLLGQGTPTLFFSARGTWMGRLEGPESRQGERRWRQVSFLQDPLQRATLARAMVAGKIHNQRQVLLRWARSHGAPELDGAARALALLEGRAGACTDLEVLRGLEGLAARHYFGVFPRALQNPAFAFHGRNRRPPRDPINAALSFLYAVMLNRVQSAVWAAGLDPYVGALHETGRGAPCLALDLMEELRPMVDRLVMRLVNLGSLSPADFIDPAARGLLVSMVPADALREEEEAAQEPAPVGEGEAVWLGETARGIVLRELLTMWRSEAPSPARGDQRFALQEVVRHQALQVAAVVEGRQARYLPLVLPH
jgi:CRISPR-associated protein Cas1